MIISKKWLFPSSIIYTDPEKKNLLLKLHIVFYKNVFKSLVTINFAMSLFREMIACFSEVYEFKFKDLLFYYLLYFLQDSNCVLFSFIIPVLALCILYTGWSGNVFWTATLFFIGNSEWEALGRFFIMLCFISPKYHLFFPAERSSI